MNAGPDGATMDRKATDAMTWDEELDKLFGDSGFLRYHKEYVKRREFNVFDVLRYADFEIRHSNVMAWMLDPTGTHGIGRRFLEWFLERASLPGKMPGKIVRGDGGQTVRVERESWGYGYYGIYSHQLVGDEILSGRSTEAVTEAVRQAVTDFLNSEDSDYTRINDYFRCLAFRPNGATSAKSTILRDSTTTEKNTIPGQTAT